MHNLLVIFLSAMSVLTFVLYTQKNHLKETGLF